VQEQAPDCPGNCSHAKQESFFVQFLVKLHQVCVNCILFYTCNWNLQKEINIFTLIPVTDIFLKEGSGFEL
jgi:hypothetical protein